MTTATTAKTSASDNINLREIAALMAETAALEKRIAERQDPLFESQIQTLSLGLFRLVVMGEVKKGKSSFINALLGIDGLVPVQSDVATSTIFKVRYGKEVSYTVYFQREKPTDPPSKKDITQAELAAYGTETGNEHNVKKVDFIGVQAPAPLLKDGLLIIDTPGVGGLFKEHRDITWRYAPRADAIFFVTDSVESSIGRDEIAFLKELRTVTSLIYFVQTKKDEAPSIEARSILMNDNAEKLKTMVGIPAEQLRYFVVSAKLKLEADKNHDMEDLKDSGYLPLIRFLLKELKEKKERNMALVALGKTFAKLRTLEIEHEKQVRIAEADTEEKRKILLEENERTEKAVAEWNQHKRPALQAEFTGALNTIRADAQTALNLLLKPQGKLADDIQLQIERIDTVNDIYAFATVQQQNLAAKASRLFEEIRKVSEDKARALLDGMAAKAEVQLAAQFVELPREEAQVFEQMPIAQIIDHTHAGNSYRNLRTVMMGGSAGAGVVAIVGSILSGGVMTIPIVGLLAAAWWGGRAAYNFQTTQDCAVARRDVMDAVNRQLGNYMTLASGEFQKAFQAIQAQGERCLREIVQRANESLVSQRQQLQKRKHETEAEVSKRRSELQLREAALQRTKTRAAVVEKQLAA